MAATNRAVSTSTIVAPDAASAHRLTYSPTTADTTPTRIARPIIRPKRTVSSWAVAAGVTSIATTRMMPTALSETTIVSATTARKTYSSNSTGRPEELLEYVFLAVV